MTPGDTFKSYVSSAEIHVSQAMMTSQDHTKPGKYQQNATVGRHSSESRVAGECVVIAASAEQDHAARHQAAHLRETRAVLTS